MASKAAEVAHAADPKGPTPAPKKKVWDRANRKGLSGFAFVIKKLFTKEDPQFLHKILGLAALVSFFYRYGYCYNVYGNLGFEGSALDWATMVVHTLLSTSSLIFHVLQARILRKPYIIWEEYRLHAISFTLRCTAVFILASVVQGIPVPTALVASGTLQITHEQFRFALIPGVLVWHLIADEISRRYATRNEAGVMQTTVRGNGRLKPKLKLLTRIYAFYQFAAIASHLIPSERSMDLGYNTLIAIQSSAFLMTLYRKGLIPYAMHAVGYTLCLILSAFHIFRIQYTPKFVVGLFSVFAMRLTFGRTSWIGDKYFLWVSFALLASIPQSAVEQLAENEYSQMAIGAANVPLNMLNDSAQALNLSGWYDEAAEVGTKMGGIALDHFTSILPPSNSHPIKF